MRKFIHVVVAVVVTAAVTLGLAGLLNANAEPQTRVVEVKSTPQECIDALNASQVVQKLAADALGIAITDLRFADLSEIDGITANMKVAVGAYNIAAAECRGGA